MRWSKKVPNVTGWWMVGHWRGKVFHHIVRDRIVELIGDLPRVELFARTPSKGWDVFGNEVESTISL